jgi:hypothetical protein
MASRKVTLFLEQPPGIVRKAIGDVQEAWFAPDGFADDVDVRASDAAKGEGGKSVVTYTSPSLDDERHASLQAEIVSAAGRRLEAALS